MVPIEPVSFSIGVATLFTTCIDAFKYFKAGQAQHKDHQLLELEFDLIKSRMLFWGNAIGIGNIPAAGKVTQDEMTSSMTLLTRSLDAIKSLLEDHENLQNRYGIREVPGTRETTDAVRVLPSFQPLNLFRTSRAYIRLRGVKLKNQSISIAANTAWAILDKEKFESLIAHLKTLVDELEKIYPIPTAARDQSFQSSIALIELSKLSILDTACEKLYPELEWASIARTVQDASESGTIDLRNVFEWQADTTSIDIRSKSSLSFKDPFGYRNVEILLVLTAGCRFVNMDLSCEASLSQLFSYEKESRFADPSYLGDEQPPWDLSSRLLSKIAPPIGLDTDTLPELQKLAMIEGKELAFQKGLIYIYCAPCICQIWTAFRICRGADALAQYVFQFCVRIDDRLMGTCCQPSVGTAKLEAILEEIRAIEINPGPDRRYFRFNYVPYIDRDWIDGRLYERDDEILQTEADNDAKNLSFVFHSSEGSRVKAVIVLGERDYLVPLLQYSPFQTLRRPAREHQFFRVDRKPMKGDTGWQWFLKYGGSFSSKLPLSSQLSAPNQSGQNGEPTLPKTTTTATASKLRSRDVSPSIEVSTKRPRTQSSLSD